MIELCCKYLSVRCIWVYVIIMSRTFLGFYPITFVYSRFLPKDSVFLMFT